MSVLPTERHRYFLESFREQLLKGRAFQRERAVELSANLLRGRLRIDALLPDPPEILSTIPSTADAPQHRDFAPAEGSSMVTPD